MKRMLQLAAVLVVGIAIGIPIGIAVCSKPAPDPYAKYRDVQLKRGMKIADIKQQFGEPDKIYDFWIDDPDYRDPYNHNYRKKSRQQSPDCPYRVQKLYYGAFGAHSQESGHVTEHRLEVRFLDGELVSWEKSTPVGRD